MIFSCAKKHVSLGTFDEIEQLCLYYSKKHTRAIPSCYVNVIDTFGVVINGKGELLNFDQHVMYIGRITSMIYLIEIKE